MQGPGIHCLQETDFRLKDTHRLKAKSWKTIFHGNGNVKKAGVALLIWDKIDFKAEALTKDKKGQFIMIKG